MKNSERVWIRDVAPRDGFQIEPQPVTLEVKVETINALAKAGIPCIEATSFVHPKAVPQMADASEIMVRIERYPGTRYAVLVPNIVGAQRALESNPDQINLVVSASASHNRANLNRDTFETLEGFREIARLVSGTGVVLQGGIATSFGCPFEGRVPIDRVLQVVDRYVELGVEAVGLADTTGMANPRQVQENVEAVQKHWPNLEIHLHFHNTRGMGLANVFAGYISGVRHFDASLGGIGGCPFAPGATGNICTEDTIHMFQEMGVETGVDLDALIEASKRLEKQLGHTLPGQVMKAGKTTHLHPMPSGSQYGK